MCLLASAIPYNWNEVVRVNLKCLNAKTTFFQFCDSRIFWNNTVTVTHRSKSYSKIIRPMWLPLKVRQQIIQNKAWKSNTISKYIETRTHRATYHGWLSPSILFIPISLLVCNLEFFLLRLIIVINSRLRCSHFRVFILRH